MKKVVLESAGGYEKLQVIKNLSIPKPGQGKYVWNYHILALYYNQKLIRF